MTHDPMTVDPKEEPEQEPGSQGEPAAASTAAAAPDPLGFLKELPPDYTIKMKPNERIRILSKDGQEEVTYPIGGGAPPEPPPSGDPTETAFVQWDVAETDTDIALTAPLPATVLVGSVFLIDAEYMDVVDISNVDNPGVTRGTRGSTVATHAAGAEVSIWEA